jgi:hypothetical protein
MSSYDLEQAAKLSNIRGRMTASGSENTYAQLYPYCVSVGTARMSLGKTVRVIWKRHALPFPFAFFGKPLRAFD